MSSDNSQPAHPPIMHGHGKPKFCLNCGDKLAEREIDGAMRPACDSCGYVHYTDPKVAVGVLIGDILKNTLRKRVARDDVLDAAVAALTACQPEMLLRTLPAKPAKDAHGLPMEMVYAAADTGCVGAA